MNLLKNKFLPSLFISVGCIAVAVSQNTPPPPSANKGPSFPGLPVPIDEHLFWGVCLALIIGVAYTFYKSVKLSE